MIKLFDAIIFDLEGIIIDTEGFRDSYGIWDNATKLFLANYGLEYDRDKIKPLLMSRGANDQIKILKSVFGQNCFGDVKNDILIKEKADIAKECFKADIDFIPGFRNFYDKLHKGYKMAVATSMDPELFALVDKKLKISKLFGEHIYTVNGVGVPNKPSPEIYLYAAKQLGVDPSRCLGIEDSPNGVLAVKRAGMYCVALMTTSSRNLLNRADQVVDRYSEIYVPYK